MPYSIGMRKGCVYIMQETTGNDVTRMCRNDKIMCAIFALNIAIIVIWSLALNLGAPAKNTERKKANPVFAQTEKLQNSVEPKENYSIVPLFYAMHEEVEQVTMSIMTDESVETETESNQLDFEDFKTMLVLSSTSVSEAITESSHKCAKQIENYEANIPKTTEPVAEEPVTTEAEVQEIATEAETEAEVVVEEIPYVEEPVYMEEYVEPATEAPVTYSYDGPVLSSWVGTVQGPSGKETFYNLDMTGVISLMNSCGYYYNYWVREDGCKMFGDYIMCAASFDIRPRGSLVETSLGTAIVCDTGTFAYSNPYQIDIATTW